MAEAGAAKAPSTGNEVARELFEHDELRMAWRTVDLPEGEVLFSQGEAGDAFYVLLEGRLEVFTTTPEGDRLTLAFLSPGAQVGELAPLDGGTRTASVRGAAPSKLASLHRNDFLAALESSPELMRETVAVLAKRMRRTVGYVDAMSRWSELVADGKYDDARDLVRSQSSLSADPNIRHFVEAFLHMVDGVRAREAKLRHELTELRIQIDRHEQERQVLEITDTSFFKSLEAQAEAMRSRHRGDDVQAGSAPGRGT